MFGCERRGCEDMRAIGRVIMYMLRIGEDTQQTGKDL